MRDLLDYARGALRSRLPGRSAPSRRLDRFAALLEDGFQAQLARALQAPPPVPPSFAWPDLPGADSVESRRYRAETDAADMQFAEFDMLWVAAVPLDAVGRQPLHPASYLAALRSAVELADVLPELHRLWLRHMQSALPGKLAGVYLRLASGLEAAGVQPTSAEERRAAQVVVVDSPVERPVDLATFTERFAQRFEHTLPPDSVFGDRDREGRAVPPQSDDWVQADRARPGGTPSVPRPADAAAPAPPAVPAAPPAADRWPAEGAWLELASDREDAVGADLHLPRWHAWQVAWHGAGSRLWLLRDAEGRSRSLTRSAFLRLQREGRLRLP
jgi:hypothetical protein